MNLPLLDLLIELPHLSTPSRIESPLINLPTELLHEIADNVATPSSRIRCKDLSNLALTCGAFRTIAQEKLFRALAIAVTPKDSSWRIDTDYIDSAHICLLRFVRTLLERPDLRTYVKELNIRLCGRASSVCSCKSLGKNKATEAEVLVENCISVIQSSKFQANRKRQWEYDLRSDQFWCGAFWGIVLSLLPNVEQLRVYSSSWGYLELFPALFGSYHDFRYSSKRAPNIYSTSLGILYDSPSMKELGTVQGLSTVKSLIFEGGAPLRTRGMRYLPNLKTLDLATGTMSWYHMPMDRNGDRILWDPFDLRHITSLRLGCNMRAIPGISLHDWISCTQKFLAALTNLRHLELYDIKEADDFDETDSEIYERCWRVLVEGGFIDPECLKRSYDVLLWCVPITGTLETLELPSGWWEMKWNTKIYPIDITRFGNLQRLIVPESMKSRIVCRNRVEVVGK